MSKQTLRIIFRICTVFSLLGSIVAVITREWQLATFFAVNAFYFDWKATGMEN